MRQATVLFCQQRFYSVSQSPKLGPHPPNLPIN
uniref:Uncharacterized protein n=1 Tax=Arundo donax TaxID=35708 RepID=A0A0A9F0F5_ARUDO